MWGPALFFLLASFLHFSLSEDSRLDSVPCKKVELGMSSLHVLLLYQMPIMEPRSVRKWIWLASRSGERKERDCGGDWILFEFYLDNWRIRGCRSWDCTRRGSEILRGCRAQPVRWLGAKSNTGRTQWIQAKRGQPQMWKRVQATRETLEVVRWRKRLRY